MRIATWNVNGLRARLDFIRIWLEQRQPDIVGLQEVKAEADDFPRSAFEDMGYETVLHGQKGWNGVAVLSRLPVEDSFRGLPSQKDMGARLAGARIAGLTFVTVYCPNGKSLEHEDYGRKLAWLDDLAAFWSGQGVEKGILCGDFNVVPKPVDGWRGEEADGEIFHTPRKGGVSTRCCARDPGRSLSRIEPGCERVLLVGLPGRRIPLRAWIADRFPAGYAAGTGPRDPGRDRPGLSQEERRADGVRSRAGDRGSRLGLATAIAAH